MPSPVLGLPFVLPRARQVHPTRQLTRKCHARSVTDRSGWTLTALALPHEMTTSIPPPEIRIQKLEASAGFEPAVEVLQPATRSSPEVARVHPVLNLDANRSLEFAIVQQGSAALPSMCDKVSASMRV